MPIYLIDRFLILSQITHLCQTLWAFERYIKRPLHHIAPHNRENFGVAMQLDFKSLLMTATRA